MVRVRLQADRIQLVRYSYSLHEELGQCTAQSVTRLCSWAVAGTKGSSYKVHTLRLTTVAMTSCRRTLETRISYSGATCGLHIFLLCELPPTCCPLSAVLLRA